MMTKILALNAVPDSITVHPFGTLAVAPMLQHPELGSGDEQMRVVKLDNGHHYLLTPNVATALLRMRANVGNVHGVRVAKDILEKGTGMVWHKGSNHPYSYITMGYNGSYIEQRVATADLGLHVDD